MTRIFARAILATTPTSSLAFFLSLYHIHYNYDYYNQKDSSNCYITRIRYYPIHHIDITCFAKVKLRTNIAKLLLAYISYINYCIIHIYAFINNDFAFLFMLLYMQISSNRERIRMNKLYFVRHGQTIWNVENKICGATDIALTDLGMEQARKTGEEILKSGIHADEILYSPLVRAKNTALCISEITGIPAREELRLKEQNFGKYESTPRNGEEFKLAKTHFIDSYCGGETMLKLTHRIYGLLDDLKKASKDKTFILVAHNGIARAINSYFYDMTNEEYAAFGVKNCEIITYTFE